MTIETVQRMCRFPGCERPAVSSSEGVGRPSEYCDDPQHTRAAAWRARQKLAEGPRPVEAFPVDAARQRASMITGQVTGMIEHLGQQLTVLVEELRTVGDPEAVEAQLEAVSSEAAEQVATANARATRAEQGQRRAEAEKAEADAAATEATAAVEELTAALAQARQDLHDSTLAREALVAELAAVQQAMATAQAHADEVQTQLRDDLAVARSELADAITQRDEAQARGEETQHALAAAQSRAETAVAETEVLRARLGELQGAAAVLTAERDAARVETQRERVHADQRVADLQAAFDAQLHQRQAEITQAREELHVYQERAIRAEALGPAPKRRS